jgi:hypothetical protein
MVKLLKILLISILFLGCELKSEQTKSGDELIHSPVGFEEGKDGKVGKSTKKKRSELEIKNDTESTIRKLINI